ncbi:MAG: nuclear transport factor 2 family protein [Deltaproteobacteria bacterium]|nr:nuclear transport factor 2 family protein [Deltaproteobacteria bacterium]
MNRIAATILFTAMLSLLTLTVHAQDASENSSAPDGACGAPHQYVKLINDGKYDSVGSLFADDALYMGPDGKTRHGSRDIGAFYSRFLPKLKPHLQASRFFEQGNECMMELENKTHRTGEFMPAAVDHFTVDSAGKISTFIVYLRPGSETTRALRNALSETR